jgi:geranylgeranyl diphosphate synthase type I
VIRLPETRDLLKEIGEPIVKSAFADVANAEIPSATARSALISFSERWKDYSRAALMVMCCEAVGGDPAAVLPAAKALVLSGGAFDLHDDIVDGSMLRTDKGIQTTLGRYGQNVTMLAGDALLIEGLSQLYLLSKQMPLERVGEIVRTIKNGLYELGSAEVDELELVHNANVTPDVYLRIVRMKAADVESYTRVGAMAGGGSAEEIDALGTFGRMLGMAVILRDDIEDTFNDKRELFSRIAKESLPLPLIYSLDDPCCVEKITEIQATGAPAELDALLGIIENNGSFEKTKAYIQELLQQSKLALRHVKDPSKLLTLFNE